MADPTKSAFDYPGALEEICTRIEGGETMAAIAKDHGVHRSRLTRWVQADPERRAAVEAARIASAEALVEEADEGLRKATNMFELRRADARAYHLRWLAKSRDPRRFGDKMQLDANHTGNLKHEHVGLSATAALLAEVAGESAAGAPAEPVQD